MIPRAGTASTDGRAGWPLWVTAAALTVAILGPLTHPGYVLSYDMLFVPAQHLSWHLIAPPDSLPRAVPLDAAVAVANLAVPGWLLQRIALASIVVAAALGAARAVPTSRDSIRVLAAVGYVWTPYLAERLLIGQWALLCAYAALPWLVIAAIELRRARRGPRQTRVIAQLVIAAAAASLTPTGGLLALVSVAALLFGAVRRRVAWLMLGAVAALNLPWIIAATISRASGRSDPAGVAAFAARAENWSGAVGALAGTGGIWNRLTTPSSRASAVIPVVTAVLVAGAIWGWPRLRDRLPAGLAPRLAWLGLGGFVLALAGATPPGAAVVRFLVANVPGAGLLRDGQKFLIPYVLLLVLAAACGVERLIDRVGRESGRIVLAGALILPVLAMPDLAWGGAGALRPVSYPDDWAAVAGILSEQPGELIALPFAGYRRFDWNGRVVIDPAPRYFDVPVVVDDLLIVDGRSIEGEDGRAAEIRARLAAGTPAAALGPAWILVEGPGVPDAMLAGLELVYQGPQLTLYRNPDGRPPPVPAAGGRYAMAGAYLVALVVCVGPVIAMAGSAIGRRRRSSR